MKVLIDLENLRDSLYEKDAITMEGIKIINSYLSAASKPNKPISTRNYSGYKCPICGARMSYADVLNGNHNYCYKCGEKLQ